jgi:HPt (histidine-containing phosphotransfer) domain-containing protein
MYCDARTGVFTYYTTSGGCTEKDVINAVSAEVSFKKWHASSQIIYENVYGQLAALVPVLGSNGTYQSLAIVKTDNRKVALGKTPQDALVEFQKLTMNVGGQISTENAKNIFGYRGKVTRIGWETTSTGKQYYLYFGDFVHSFMVTSGVQSELALTKEGDLVEIKYIDSKQASLPTTYFRNLTLNIQESSNEKSVGTQMQERKEKTDLKSDVKDFKENLKNMSDEEMKKLMNTQKK